MRINGKHISTNKFLNYKPIFYKPTILQHLKKNFGLYVLFFILGSILTTIAFLVFELI